MPVNFSIPNSSTNIPVRKARLDNYDNYFRPQWPLPSTSTNGPLPLRTILGGGWEKASFLPSNSTTRSATND